jgi:hypothetical protein
LGLIENRLRLVHVSTPDPLKVTGAVLTLDTWGAELGVILKTALHIPAITIERAKLGGGLFMRVGTPLILLGAFYTTQTECDQGGLSDGGSENSRWRKVSLHVGR